MTRFINIGFINEAKIEQGIEIKEHNYIKRVTFFYTPSENWYSWRAITESNRAIYPSASNENILTFKTLNGAKRNFIKNYLKEKE